MSKRTVIPKQPAKPAEQPAEVGQQPQAGGIATMETHPIQPGKSGWRLWPFANKKGDKTHDETEQNDSSGN